MKLSRKGYYVSRIQEQYLILKLKFPSTFISTFSLIIWCINQRYSIQPNPLLNHKVISLWFSKLINRLHAIQPFLIRSSPNSPCLAIFSFFWYRLCSKAFMGKKLDKDNSWWYLVTRKFMDSLIILYPQGSSCENILR